MIHRLAYIVFGNWEDAFMLKRVNSTVLRKGDRAQVFDSIAQWELFIDLKAVTAGIEPMSTVRECLRIFGCINIFALSVVFVPISCRACTR